MKSIVTQLIVWFRPELDVTYGNGLFHSSAASMQPVNDLLKNYPDARIETLFAGDRGEIPAHMKGYYTISLEDSDRVQTLRKQLLSQTSIIKAAYFKSPAETP